MAFLRHDPAIAGCLVVIPPSWPRWGGSDLSTFAQLARGVVDGCSVAGMCPLPLHSPLLAFAPVAMIAVAPVATLVASVVAVAELSSCPLAAEDAVADSVG